MQNAYRKALAKSPVVKRAAALHETTLHVAAGGDTTSVAAPLPGTADANNSGGLLVTSSSGKRVSKHRTSRYWLDDELLPFEHIWLPASSTSSLAVDGISGSA